MQPWQLLDIQTKGEWSSKAYKVYVAKDEVERLQRFGHMVDDSSDSKPSDEDVDA